MRGPSFGGCDQKALRDRSSHNTRRHGLGISDAQSIVDDAQQRRINPSGVYVRSPFRETQCSENRPCREPVSEKTK